MRLLILAWVIFSSLIATGCGAVSGLSGITPGTDTTPPTVTSTAPALDASVPADAPVAVTFNKPMNTRSVTITAQPPIAFGPAQWSTDERTVTFRPEVSLSPGTRYAVSITGRDRAGNAMAPFSWAFSASAPGARTGAGELRLKDRVEARADQRLFTLFAALNASGYDDGANEAGPVRAAVREKMGDLPLKTVEPFRKFRSDHPQALEAYVAYVLSLAAPPDFAEQRAPGDLDRLNRILADFYAAAKIADLWKTHSEPYAKAAETLASDGLAVMGKVMDYLRGADVPASRIVLVPNLLDTAGRGYLIRSGDVATLVIGTTGASDRPALAALTARLLVSSVRIEAAADLQRTEPLFDLVRDRTRRFGLTQWEQVVRESFVMAVTAQVALPADQRDQFIRSEYAKGLILVDHFVTELTKHAPVSIPLSEFLPQILRTVNLDDERRRFGERR